MVVARPGVVSPVETVVVVDERSFSVAPTVGFHFGDAGGGVVGIQASYSRGWPLRFVPELLVGVAGDEGLIANADIAVDVGGQSARRRGAPYLRTGLGFVNMSGDAEDDDDTELTFNLGVGATLGSGRGRFFVDFSSGNFGAYNRLTGGYRIAFGR